MRTRASNDFTVPSVAAALTVTVKTAAIDGTVKSFEARVRIDTPEELVAFRNGGILPYVLRQLLRKK